MKQAPAELVEQLKKGTAIKALPEMVVDWNLNRYHDTNVDNKPREENAGFDVELFPIESIVEPNRPNKGINKARVGHSTISREYRDVGGGKDARFYIADEDDVYKYWTSPLPAVDKVMPIFNLTNFPNDVVTEMNGHDDITSVRPKVEYGSWSEQDPSQDFDEDFEPVFTPGTVDTNKIVIKVENTWASPDDFDIVITRPAGTVTVNSSELSAGWEGPGEIVLRWDGTSWHSDHPLTTVNNLPIVDTISSIQLRVRTMKGGYQKTEPGETPVRTLRYDEVNDQYNYTTGSDSYFDLIEIAAHLEADLTNWLVDVGTTFDMAESSNLYPIGTITTNLGTITLSNVYENAAGEWVLGLFSNDNDDPDIPWKNYLEANAYVKVDYVFYDDDDNFLARLRELSMYTDVWSGQADEAVILELSDYSKFLNEDNSPAAMWENLKVPELVWRVLDTVGFSNYEIDRDVDRVTEHRIPIFYMDGTTTPWGVLDELAKASQTAIYFDNYGVLRVKTRDFAFSSEAEPVWKFQSYNDVDKLADIEALTQTTEFEPNSIKVIYQATNWSKYQNGVPIQQKVWEPESESIVLRGAPLVKDFNTDDRLMWISDKDAKVWPYESLVNIQGEIVKYRGKQFEYYSGAQGNVKNTTIVYSLDEKNDIERDKATDGYYHKNHFTGALRIDRDEKGRRQRGLWNTQPKNHKVDADGWNVRSFINDKTRYENVSGFKHIKADSQIELNPGPRHKDYKDLMVVTKGHANDAPFWFFGTQMKFVKKSGRSTQTAGIVVNNYGLSEGGYYFELTPSDRLAGKKNSRAELVVYKRAGGKPKRVGKKSLAIGENIWYEVDVTVAVRPNGGHRLGLWLNGKNVFDETVPNAETLTPNGKFGVFARGKTTVRYEFFYAVKKAVKELPDDFSFLDKVRRAFYGQQWDREWVYEWRQKTVRRKKKKSKVRYRYNDHFFDEFGPYLHEIRDFDVKYDPAPVLHSRLYSTNDWSSVLLDYKSNPFGAKFTIANTSRGNVVVHGEDKLSFSGTDNAVEQLLTVFGRPLIVEEDKEILVENTDQIRSRGKIVSELSDKWIQTEAMAKSLAAWIRYNFTYGNDQLTMTVFGNPLVQPSDIVTVDYPEKNILGDYFVIAVRNSYEAGIMTELDLRRRV